METLKIEESQMHGGQIIKDARLAKGLTLRQLAQAMANEADTVRTSLSLSTTYVPPNQSTLSRIESGLTGAPLADTLKALAHVLSIEYHDLEVAFFEIDSGAFRVGIAHTIFGAPVLAALLGQPIENLQASNLGAVIKGEYEPRFSNLSPAKRTLITPILSNEEFTGKFPASATQGIVEDTIDFDAHFGLFCLGGNLKSLWAKGQIDAAIASKDIFEEEIAQQGSVSQAVVCANLTRSVRGVAVVTLIIPTVAAKYANDKGTNLNDQCCLWESQLDALATFGAPTRTDTTQQSPSGTPQTIHPLKIWYPVGTFADQHAFKLHESASPNWGEAVLEPFNMAQQPAEICRTIFEDIKQHSQSGIGMIVLWEPYVSYFRHHWDLIIKNEHQNEFHMFAENRRNSVVQNTSGTVDYICSIEHSLGRYLGSKGIQKIPSISMDLIVRKSVLDERKKLKYNKFQSLLRFMKVTLDVGNKMSQEVNEFCVQYDSNVRMTKNFEGLFEFRPIELFKSQIDINHNKSLDSLSYVLRVPKWRLIKAMAQFEINMRFERSFIELFVPLH